MRDEWIKIYGQELKKDDNLINDRFEQNSRDLLKMGFPHRLIYHTYLKYRFRSSEEAVEILSRVNNKWTHEFVLSDFNKCFICEDFEEEHRDLKKVIENRILIEKKQSNVIQGQLELFKRKSLEQKNERKDVVLELNLKKCPICWDEIKENEKICLNCKHQYCKECIINYIKEEIKNNKNEETSCPTAECKEKFPEDIIKAYSSPEQYAKYLKFQERRRINKESDSIIHCPFVNCEGYANKVVNNDSLLANESNVMEKLLDNEKKEITKIKYTCNYNHSFCSLCLKSWHDYTSCKEDENVAQFATESGFILKKCPNCKVWTEKTLGCNHMTCKICKFSWCWLCNLECLPDHYLVEGTPCYGKQFNENQEDQRELETIFNDIDSFTGSVFYFFKITIALSAFFLGRIYANDPNEPNRRRPNKCTIYSIFLILVLIITLISCLTNLILIIYMLKNITRMNQMRENCKNCIRLILGFSFMIIWFLFFFLGIVLTVIWLLIMMIYITYKILNV